MPAFQDIFVAQILGMLRARGFNGQAVLTFGDGLSVDSHFAQGALFHVQTSAHVSGAAAIARIAWRSSGQVTLQALSSGTGRSAIALDDTLLDLLPALPGSLPLLLRAQVYRLAPNAAPTPSRYAQTAAQLNQRLVRPTLLSQLQEGSNTEFWPALAYLALQGQLGIEYATTLNPLTKGLYESVVACIRKLQGNAVATAYNTRYTQHMNRWPTLPDPVSSKFSDPIPDPIYGTAPYRDALATLEITLNQAGAAALNKRCYQQMLSTLSPQQNNLLQQLK